MSLQQDHEDFTLLGGTAGADSRPSAPRRDDGGPAFPHRRPSEYVAYPDTCFAGMTLRDWFAGQALTAVLEARAVAGLDCGQESIALECYELADALLDARAK